MKITTFSTTSDGCPDLRTCPSKNLVDVHPERVYMIGTVETDPELLAAFASRIGPGEALYWQPRKLHPEVLST